MDFVDYNKYYQKDVFPDQTNKMKRINKDLKKLMMEMNMSVSMDESVRISKFSKRTSQGDKNKNKEVKLLVRIFFDFLL